MNHEEHNNRSSVRRLLALVGRPLRRRMGSDPVLAATFALVILITAAAVAAVPMILNRVGDRGLVEALDSALVIQRGIALEFEGRIPAQGSGHLRQVEERGDNYREGLPLTIRGIITDTEWVADTARHHHLLDELTIASGAFQQYFQFRYQSSLDDQIELIDGREPQPAEPIRLSEAADLPEDYDDDRVPLFEVKIGEGTAETLELELGDRFVILADRHDRLSREALRTYFDQYIVIEVVGIFRPLEPESDFWYRDYRTYRTDVYADPDQTIYYSMGIPSEEVLAELMELNERGYWRYGWRYFVDPEGVAMTDVNRTASDLVSLRQNLGPYHELAEMRPVEASRQISIRSLLPTLLTGAERQYRLTSAVLSLVVAGILTIGVSLSGLLGALVASRRTPEIALMRSRGASGHQLSLSHILEGWILAVPAAVLGVLVALLLIGGPLPVDSIIVAAVVALSVVVALWALTRRIWSVDLGSLLGRRADVPGGSSQRRVVAELLIVSLAIAGIVVLRQRGVTTGAAQEGFDPYIAAVPVLCGIAVGIVAVRILPLFLRQAALFAGRRPDIVPFLGLRRIAEPSLGRHLPLVVMVLALGMAVFAGAIWYSIETPEAIPLHEIDVDEAATMRTAPAGVNEAFQQGITQGFWLTVFMAGIYAGLAVVCALALTSEERRRDVGYLRTLGASRNQALGLTLIEQVPSALLAGIIGAGFGGLLTWLIAPGLDIASLYPADQPVVIGVNWFLAAGQAIALVLVAVGAAGAFAYIARRSALSDVLRTGE